MFSGLRSVWIRFKSCKTSRLSAGGRRRLKSLEVLGSRAGEESWCRSWEALTRNARKELTGKVLYLAVGEGHEIVALQEVKHALAEEVHDDTYMASEVEAVPEMDATVSVLLVIRLERCQDSEFDLARIPILLYRSDDFDRNQLVTSPVLGLDDFAECSLAKEFYHLVWNEACQHCSKYFARRIRSEEKKGGVSLTSIGEVCIRNHNVVPVVIINSGIAIIYRLR